MSEGFKLSTTSLFTNPPPFIPSTGTDSQKGTPSPPTSPRTKASTHPIPAQLPPRPWTTNPSFLIPFQPPQDEDLEEDPDDDLDVFGNNGLNTSPLHFNKLLMTSTSV